MSKIILKKNEDRRLAAGHQWIFSNEIESVSQEAASGEVVELFSSGGKFLGKGFYNKNSLIAYRHLTSKDESIDKNFLFRKISMANSLRKKSNNAGEVYRMVNSESDFLPGLIIDKFGSRYSVQTFALGIDNYLQTVKEILIENFKAAMIVEKNDNQLRTLEGLERKQGIIFEEGNFEDKTFEVTIDEVKYEIDLLNGQKTGFYLDQRENRRIIRDYVKENYSVLDLFCNEGGFAINAAFAKATDITAVDSSEHSIKMAKRNAELNGYQGMDFIDGDAFEFINSKFQSSDRYDFIILDPPSFTKSRKNLIPALKGYEELNYKAMKLLKPNSFLFTFSCSHHISEKNFEDMLNMASAKAKRKIQIIEFRNCSFDHPVIPQMNETKYLKGYLIRVST